MKRTLPTFLLSVVAVMTSAQQTLTINVSNPNDCERRDIPVVITLNDYQQHTSSALVMAGKEEIACQLDDLNGDNIADELCFLADVGAGKTKQYDVTLLAQGSPRIYPPRTFAELMLRNPKVKIKNKHDIFLHELTVERGVNPYSIVHHHGVAFESELIAMRIYFDHRQTVDLYGKNRKGLEIKDTQFYPDEEQLKKGYGDDVLWCGTSFGLGALRGWDGQKQTMLEDVERRTQRVITMGPVRTIVEIVDAQWKPKPDLAPVDMTTRYTLYGGHRDCAVDISFSQPVPNYLFATGLVNVEGSREYSDGKGLRGCWGSAYAVSGADTLTHPRETVGLGICIPRQHIVSEERANPVDYGYVVSTTTNKLHYDIVYTSDKEKFGYHSADDWFGFLRTWKKEIENPVRIQIKRQ